MTASVAVTAVLAAAPYAAIARGVAPSPSPWLARHWRNRLAALVGWRRTASPPYSHLSQRHSTRMRRSRHPSGWWTYRPVAAAGGAVV